jgi:diketogulonate reductase-like aldo/keto reductase
MLPQDTEIGGVRVPRFLYGTAWKESETQRLTELSLQQGFRGIDTANQRRHYHEAAVGQAISAAITKGWVARDDLFLQTKFTFRNEQDHRLPYDPAAPIPFALDVGILPLTGTTDAEHMRADLDVFDFRLESDEVERIEHLAAA